MKRLRFIFVLLALPAVGNSQLSEIDSIRRVIESATQDSTKFISLQNIAALYGEMNRDSALHFERQSLELAQKNGKKLSEGYVLVGIGYQLTHKGEYGEALRYFLKAFEIARDPANESSEWQTPYNVARDTANGSQKWHTDHHSPEQNRLSLLAYTHHMFAILMSRSQNTGQEIFHFLEARRIGKQAGSEVRIMLAAMNLGNSYFRVGRIDSALYFEKEALEISHRRGFLHYLSGIYFLMGKLYQAKDEVPLARDFFYAAIAEAYIQNNIGMVGRVYSELAAYHLQQGNIDSGLYYAHRNREVLLAIGSVNIENNLGTAYETLFTIYKKKGITDSALKYAELGMRIKDTIYRDRISSLSDMQKLSFSEQLRLEKEASEREISRGKMIMYAVLAGLSLILLTALILYRSNRQKQRANKRLADTLADLRATQAQLIHSEKMASLGQLTAGIAHEIQNPLNFVNNFSELNKELIDEMDNELAGGNIEEAKAIARIIRENQEKINHHGKRADSIVKGMLQHSRSSRGVKEPTDINALADEYLRLAYHGLRAKDKTFNATVNTDLDKSLGNVNVISQDIGRVILNLITNAFYAVSEKKKQGAEGFVPTVTVKTRKVGNRVEISVKDNGNGIPAPALDKIFQPFFTTKPAGEGTGLGLSLSYDIVKAHGGELKVDTIENAGTEFIISLPA